jgi:hypothetical protein
MAALGLGSTGFGAGASMSVPARAGESSGRVCGFARRPLHRAVSTRTAALHTRPSHFRDNSIENGSGSAADSSGGGEGVGATNDYITHVYNSMNDMETVGLTVDHDVSHGAPPLLRGLDVPKLLHSMADIQKKNTELQKQLAETVSLLSTAAEVLNSYSETKQVREAGPVIILAPSSSTRTHAHTHFLSLSLSLSLSHTNTHTHTHTHTLCGPFSRASIDRFTSHRDKFTRDLPSHTLRTLNSCSSRTLYLTPSH